jgi:hypothetical protein
VKRQPPFDVLMGAVEEIPCELTAIKPGPFESQLHVYLADDGLREIVLKVHGEAKAADIKSPGLLPAGSSP